MNNSTKPSILVLGSKGYTNATKCIEWGELAYVGDYDFLIVDTSTLSKEIMQTILQKDPTYFESLRKDITDVQQNKGIEITCILSPYVFTRDVDRSDNVDEALKNNTNNYSWSPIIPILEKIPRGEKISKEKSSLCEEYLNKIKGYDRLYNGTVNNTGYVDKSENGSIYTKAHFYSILKNMVGRNIAFGVQWKVHQYSDYTILINSNKPIEFFPPLENTKEGVEIIIRNICHSSEEMAPEWISTITLPGENKILTEVQNKVEEIDEKNKEIKSLQEDLERLSIHKKLIYAQGTELEEAVENAFSVLGIILKKPGVSNIEDRYFETGDNQKIYVEIRGVNRLMNEGDLAQLIKRVAEKPVSSLYKTRGIFVFNHQNKLAPNDRDPAFHFNIEKQAETFSLCLIDTKTLLTLITEKLSGKDINNLDQIMFNIKGTFKEENIREITNNNSLEIEVETKKEDKK